MRGSERFIFNNMKMMICKYECIRIHAYGYIYLDCTVYSLYKPYLCTLCPNRLSFIYKLDARPKFVFLNSSLKL